AETRGGKVAIVLVGDGWFSAKDFALANPPRIVVDLPGVKNEVKQRTIAVKDDAVSRVRVSQFQTTPEYVTRVVVDLVKPMPHAPGPARPAPCGRARARRCRAPGPRTPSPRGRGPPSGSRRPSPPPPTPRRPPRRRRRPPRRGRRAGRSPCGLPPLRPRRLRP